MKTEAMQVVVSIVIASFCSASIATEPADASKTTDSGKFTLPVYPGSTLENSGRGVSGGKAYRYYSRPSRLPSSSIQGPALRGPFHSLRRFIRGNQGLLVCA